MASPSCACQGSSSSSSSSSKPAETSSFSRGRRSPHRTPMISGHSSTSSSPSSSATSSPRPWTSDLPPLALVPPPFESPRVPSSASAPPTPARAAMALGAVATRHLSLEQRFAGMHLAMNARNELDQASSSRWTRDENAASRRRHSATSSTGSVSSARMERGSALSIASSSTGRTSLSSASTSPVQPPIATSKDSAMSCEVKMPTCRPSMPHAQTPPKDSKVEVVEHEDDFIVTVWLPYFNQDLITVSRRRTQALHIVADNYCTQNAGHFERLIELEGEGDEGPSSMVKAEFIAETDMLVIKVLKRRQAKWEKLKEKAHLAAHERMMEEVATSASGETSSAPAPPSPSPPSPPPLTIPRSSLGTPVDLATIAPTSVGLTATKSWPKARAGMKSVLRAKEKARQQAEEWARLGKS